MAQYGPNSALVESRIQRAAWLTSSDLGVAFAGANDARYLARRDRVDGLVLEAARKVRRLREVQQAEAAMDDAVTTSLQELDWESADPVRVAARMLARFLVVMDQLQSHDWIPGVLTYPFPALQSTDWINGLVETGMPTAYIAAGFGKHLTALADAELERLRTSTYGTSLMPSLATELVALAPVLGRELAGRMDKAWHFGRRFGETAIVEKAMQLPGASDNRSSWLSLAVAAGGAAGALLLVGFVRRQFVERSYQPFADVVPIDTLLTEQDRARWVDSL